MKSIGWLTAAVMVAATTGLPGCAFVAGAVAGGTAGYILKDEGYEVRSPIEKTDN